MSWGIAGPLAQHPAESLFFTHSVSSDTIELRYPIPAPTSSLRYAHNLPTSLILSGVAEVKSPSNKRLVRRWSCEQTYLTDIPRSQAISVSRWAAGSVYIPSFPFSFSNLQTKNKKRIPFSLFVFKSEVRKTNSFFVRKFENDKRKTKRRYIHGPSCEYFGCGGVGCCIRFGVNDRVTLW